MVFTFGNSENVEKTMLEARGKGGDKSRKRQKKDTPRELGEKGLTVTHGDLRRILEIRRFRKCVLLSTRIPHHPRPTSLSSARRGWKSKYVLLLPAFLHSLPDCRARARAIVKP